MALEFSTGFENGSAAAVFDLQSRPLTIATDFPANGQGCLRAGTDQYGRKDFAANAIKVASFRLRVTTFAGPDFKDVIRFQNNAGSQSCAVGVGNDADRRLFLNYGFGVTVLDTFPAIEPNAYYQVEFLVNATANPWAVSWRVGGIDQGSFIPAVAADSFDRVFVGNVSSDAFDLRIDDVFVFSGSAGDYPPGDLRDYGGGPMAGGTPQRAGGGGRW